jgi:hypothetical protein
MAAKNNAANSVELDLIDLKRLVEEATDLYHKNQASAIPKDRIEVRTKTNKS